MDRNSGKEKLLTRARFCNSISKLREEQEQSGE